MPITNPVNFNAIVNKPSTLLGHGITDASQLGVGQTWKVTSRAANTAYQNTSGKPIQINCYLDGATYYTQVSTNGTTWVNVHNHTMYGRSFVIVPNGHYFRYTGTPSAECELS